MRRSLGGRAGLTLPLGSTEPNPNALDLLGLAHEHRLLCAGLPLSLVGASMVCSPAPRRAHANVGARVPFGENEYGYQAPLTVSAAAGPLRRLGPKLVVWAAQS